MFAFGDVFSIDIYARRASINKSIRDFENSGSVSDNLGINLVTVSKV